MSIAPRASLVGLLLAALVVLSGCTGKVTTTITVAGDQQADIVVAVRFTDEAAQVLAQDGDVRAGLVDLFTSRTGSRPAVEMNDQWVEVRQDVDYPTLQQVADLTGVQSLSLAAQGRELTVDLAPPTALTEAIRSQVADRPDADAVAETMLAQTAMEVVVVFAGGAEEAALSSEPEALSDGTEPSEVMGVDGTRARYAVSLDQARAVRWRVSGDPRGFPWGKVVFFAGVVAALLSFAARRRRSGGESAATAAVPR